MTNPGPEKLSEGIAKTLEEAAKQKTNTKKKPKSNKSGEELKQLKEEVAELRDKLLRSTAETENVRKRMRKQVEDACKYAVSNFAKDLIEVMENMHREIDSTSENKDVTVKMIIDGIVMTRNELESAFKKNGIIRLKPEVGEKFNHEIHQAITQVPDPNFEDGEIVNVVQAGYLIKDRLLRPAMVAVAKNN